MTKTRQFSNVWNINHYNIAIRWNFWVGYHSLFGNRTLTWQREYLSIRFILLIPFFLISKKSKKTLPVLLLLALGSRWPVLLYCFWSSWPLQMGCTLVDSSEKGSDWGGQVVTKWSLNVDSGWQCAMGNCHLHPESKKTKINQYNKVVLSR